MTTESKCPFHQGQNSETAAAGNATSNKDWWPNQLRVDLLSQHSAKSNPLGEDFNYAQAFKKLDYEAVKRDLRALMTDSQDWWPADFGHYGPLFIRMAWHAPAPIAFRTVAAARVAPSSALRRSTAGLTTSTSTRRAACCGRSSKVRQPDFLGRPDDPAATSRWKPWASHLRLRWRSRGHLGTRSGRVLGCREGMAGPTQNPHSRYSGERDLENPLAAVQMGLIYVNPEGPDGKPTRSAAHDIRDTFARMAMDDEETVALIAGGHTFGKTHGAGPPPCGRRARSRRPGSPGPGLGQQLQSGKAGDTITSGLEVTWTQTPAQWSNGFFENLFKYEWELTKSPAGATSGWPRTPAMSSPTRMAAPTKPTMLTTDLSLRFDPAYEKISRRFLENPQAFADAFARAWFKLTHRDMGPRARYLGPEVPAEELIWQDPIPAVDHPLVNDADVAALKARCWPRACRCRSWWPRPGPRPPPSAARTSAAAPTAPASAWLRKRTGPPTTRATGQGAGQARGNPARVQQGPRATSASRWPT
jgi:catalase-peroxidase